MSVNGILADMGVMSSNEIDGNAFKDDNEASATTGLGQKWKCDNPSSSLQIMSNKSLTSVTKF